MPSPFMSQAVDATVADAAHAEMSKFLDLRSPDVVNKQLDKVPLLDTFLNPSDLPKTNELVIDFLQVCSIIRSALPRCRVDATCLTMSQNYGKKLAADFLEAKDATLERSFLVLYCA
jgi:hypothetical protein